MRARFWVDYELQASTGGFSKKDTLTFDVVIHRANVSFAIPAAAEAVTVLTVSNTTAGNATLGDRNVTMMVGNSTTAFVNGTSVPSRGPKTGGASPRSTATAVDEVR